MAIENSPLILHIPHSSLRIPPEYRESILLDDHDLNQELLWMTDRYTDEIFPTKEMPESAVVFPISRLVVDPERFDDDHREPMASRGMGVIYTRTSHGGILRNPPTLEEHDALLARYYSPHQEALSRIVASKLNWCGKCLVVDGHSFSSTPLPYEPDQNAHRPDICIGTDAFHSPDLLIRKTIEFFENHGYRTGLDKPYRGTFIPSAFYLENPRVMGIMIEINRGLYMDEQTGARLERIQEITQLIQSFIENIIISLF